MILISRVAAAQATLDRFKDEPFQWGRKDCVRMAAFHLRQLGYRPKLGKAGSYSSALGARRALARAGYDSLAAALDDLGLERTPPAAALVGDIVQGASGDAFGAIGVVLGNGRILGYQEDLPGAAVLHPLALDLAWRADPCRNS